MEKALERRTIPHPLQHACQKGCSNVELSFVAQEWIFHLVERGFRLSTVKKHLTKSDGMVCSTNCGLTLESRTTYGYSSKSGLKVARV